MISTQIVDTGALKVDLLQHAPTIDTITVARLLINFEAFITGSVTVSSAQGITVGVGVASSEAFAIGTTALPDPLLDTEYPPRGWLYAGSKICYLHVVAGVGVAKQDASFQLDLRGMRKIDKGKLFLLILNNNFTGGVGTIDVHGRARALCLT